MNTMTRPVDPQLPLSLLFLAVVESTRQERTRRTAEVEREEIRDFELAQEDPERWDGMV
jgi:hypothetical protein